MVRVAALALALLLSGCAYLKDKGIRAKCKCNWELDYYRSETPPPRLK